MRFVAACTCFVLVVAGGTAYAQEEERVNDQSFDEMSGQIEGSVRNLVDRIQESVRGAVESAKPAEPLDTTLILTFQFGSTDPVRIMCADGAFVVNVDNRRTIRSKADEIVEEEAYELEIEGTISKEPEANEYRVTYHGFFHVTEEQLAGDEETRTAHMDLRGSAVATLGKTITLAENEGWTLGLTMDESE